MGLRGARTRRITMSECAGRGHKVFVLVQIIETNRYVSLSGARWTGCLSPLNGGGRGTGLGTGERRRHCPGSLRTFKRFSQPVQKMVNKSCAGGVVAAGGHGTFGEGDPLP